jgi:hypothetical protein
MAGSITREREKKRKAKRRIVHKKQKKGEKKLVPFRIGSYFI